MKRYMMTVVILVLVSIFAVGCASAGTSSAAAAATTAPAATQAPATATDAVETTSAGTTTGSAENGTLELTLAELAKYNGKDGQPAYVAVDGVIYDVTNVPQWKNGEHNGYSAGNDLTEIIKTKSPHGVAKLKGIPVVGKLIDG